MADARVVGVQQRTADDEADGGDLVGVEPAPVRDPVGHRPLAELGDEVGPCVGQHVAGMHGDDPGVREPADRAGLRPELLGRAPLGEVDVEHRDGDPAVGVVLPSPVDVGASAPAQRGELPEPGQLWGLRNHARRVASQVRDLAITHPGHGAVTTAAAGVGASALVGRDVPRSAPSPLVGGALPRRRTPAAATHPAPHHHTRRAGCGRHTRRAGCGSRARCATPPTVRGSALITGGPTPTRHTPNPASHTAPHRHTPRAGCASRTRCATPPTVRGSAVMRGGRTPGGCGRSERGTSPAHPRSTARP